MEDTEENPSLRARFGEKVASKIRAQRKLERQQQSYKTALGRFRPRKSELGSIVLVAATKTGKAKPGTRVDPSYRGKVYAVYVTKGGNIKPYREKVYGGGHRRREKTKVPVPYSPRTLDPQQFPTKRARRLATEIFVVRGDKIVPPIVIEAKRGNVGWHETVVPLASARMREMADKATGGKGVGNVPMMVDVTVEVELPDGRKKSVTVTDDFGQRREQGTKDEDYYRPYFQKKIYALVAEHLSAFGLVSASSAKRVQKSPENKGKPRSKWRWRGGPWYKRDHDVARVSKVTVQPRLIRVSRKGGSDV
jgi:hypothetical protein